MTHHWQSRTASGVHIDAPARLHLGFLDMSGSLGRQYGSLGLAIDAFRTRLTARPARVVTATGPGAERAAHFARMLLDMLGIDGGVELCVDTSIPDHMGLGSGTQMALAVGQAISGLFALPLSCRDVALYLARGRRSGIGIGAFEQGGFLLDSGIGPDGGVPQVTARMAFPEDWRLLLVMDARGQGLHGRHEVDAFRRLPPFPAEVAAHLCRLAVMQILPGVQESQLAPVADGIAELQRRVGDHFAPAQGGRFTSSAVADALIWAQSLGYTGIGQSSWGPTGFVLLPDQASADALLAKAQVRYGELSPLRFIVTRGCNQGGRTSHEAVAEAVKEIR